MKRMKQIVGFAVVALLLTCNVLWSWPYEEQTFKGKAGYTLILKKPHEKSNLTGPKGEYYVSDISGYWNDKMPNLLMEITKGHHAVFLNYQSKLNIYEVVDADSEKTLDRLFFLKSRWSITVSTLSSPPAHRSAHFSTPSESDLSILGEGHPGPQPRAWRNGNLSLEGVDRCGRVLPQ